jgi:ribose transport system ATP-binding protein
MIDRTRSVLARLDPAIAPEAPVASLTAAQRQAVEIAKGLAHACRLLILDEPTAVLAGHEAERLLAQARRLRDDGVTILFVSHRLREVRALCDRVLILRDGRTVGLEPAAELDERALAARMVGREPADVFPPRGVPSDNVCLRVEGLTARRGPPRGATFEVRAGEILGLAGLAGSGRTEVTEILAGVRPARAGRVVVDGVACPLGSPQASLRRGLAILPEDRLGAGVLAGFDVAANVTLASLSRYAAPFLDRCAIRERAERYIREFDIRCRGSDQRVGQLSGGNQQKVSLAKSLDPGPRVLLASEPTAGVDVGAKRELYAFLRDLTRQGLACLLSSSDLEEIIGLSDRVAVMRDGRVAAVLEGADVTEKTIILHATGLARDTNDN